MPPKPKEVASKKLTPLIVRQPISESSLVFVPENAVEGYQERIEKGIEWTLVEKAARYHKDLCNKPEIPILTFSEALQNKVDQSILSGFMKEQSNITLEQQWELLLPITLWDQEKFANEEGKICFQNKNCITDDLIKLIKKAVKLNDSKVLKQELKLLTTLRVNDSQSVFDVFMYGENVKNRWLNRLFKYLVNSDQMTELDEDLLEYKNVVNLNLCGNFLSNVDTTLIPPGVKSLELQVNRISDLVSLVENLPSPLLYLGLARNLITNEFIDPLCRLPYQITVLDLSDNDIYHLEPLLATLAKLPHLRALLLIGNPCAVCCGYARTTLNSLPLLKWLDCRRVLPTDRSEESFEPHLDDLRAAYFTFTVFRIMSATQPPKPEKGAVTTFHVELELPLLDSTRRQFLLFRNHESLVEMLPPPEDGSWEDLKLPSTAVIESKTGFGTEQSPHESDIYKTLTVKNSREILHYTTFESTRVQWNKIMNFQEPAVKIFCPDLIALRDTFRTVITLRVIYSVTVTAKQGKPDKKSSHIQSSMKTPAEQRVTLATIKCSLRQPDWSQPSQHFHWDDSLGTSDAIHWEDGDLSVLQYSLSPVKVAKPKQDTDVGPASRQLTPDNLTCHFGFGIETLKA